MKQLPCIKQYVLGYRLNIITKMTNTDMICSALLFDILTL